MKTVSKYTNDSTSIKDVYTYTIMLKNIFFETCSDRKKKKKAMLMTDNDRRKNNFVRFPQKYLCSTSENNENSFQ